MSASTAPVQDETRPAPRHDMPPVHAPAPAPGYNTSHINAPGFDDTALGQNVMSGPVASPASGTGVLPLVSDAPAPSNAPTSVLDTSPVRACTSAPWTMTAPGGPPASSLVRPTPSGVALPSPARTRLRAGISKPKIFTDGTVCYDMLTTATPYNPKEALSNTDWKAAWTPDIMLFFRIKHGI
jgi:hypothetical protein